MKTVMPVKPWGRIMMVSLTTAGLLLTGSGLSWADRDDRQGRQESRHENRQEERKGGRAENRQDRRYESRKDGRIENRHNVRNGRGKEDRHERRFEKRGGHQRKVTVIRELPRGHRTVVIDKTRYFVHNDRYYTRGHGGYVAARPPVGAVFATLPIGSVRVTIGSTFFFRSGDVYYRPAPRGYVVVAPPMPAPLPADLVLVEVSVLNVRSGPGTEFPVIARAWQGEALAVSGYSSGWHYVRLPDGTYGWVMSGYTRPMAAG